MSRFLIFFLFVFGTSYSRINAQSCNPVFNYAVNINDVNFTSAFNSPSLHHTWHFGDGNLGYGANPSHAYNQQGQFLVKHIVSDSLTNCRDSSVQLISLSFTSSCSSSFYFYEDFPVLNRIGFVASPLVSGTAIKKYLWKINGIAVDTTDYLLYTFPSADTYNVCLRIETYSGCVSEYCKQVTVFGYCNKNSSFITSVNPQQPGTIAFTPNPDNSQYNYWWHPGNGLGYNDRKPVIALPPGSYNVRLTITDSVNHCYDTVRQVVNIQDNVADICTASFNYSLNIQGEVSFTATSNQIIISQVWTVFHFPDSSHGATINEINPKYTFTDTGYYWVCVNLYTNTGCLRSYCQGINVNSVSGRIYNNRIPSYPNPASSEVMLNLKMEKESVVIIKVYNLSGNIVYSSQQYGIRGNNKFVIPVQTMIKGQYFIEMQYNNEKKQSVFQKL